ncbi:aromatic ring-hydroxylating dioxygenase subunit alpha [Sphingopyxis sp.]|uniref:aromatic ring-hydroxylating dioxygenase subunit alpha n=1 Tax=Sphingopyxis sp. TaxID=1908224 RepID=UPI002D79BCA0|nr:aromatic ring-hydroxylating dioxygenase subunit alpha [Sphingopyxis sp.]HET6523101.1 aromatic ring-hydroxylating dioxygenase subunit alpha [Sphingopyxis sp.]
MFLKNAWYVAGWSTDFTKDRVTALTVIDEPLVLYRTADDELVAFDGRCPHRWAPLELGRIESDGLRCMYHGVKFDSEGNCIEVPGGGQASKTLCLRKFVVEERYSWVWIWMGDPELADPSLIPDAGMMDHAHRRLYKGHMDFEADAELLCDNLLDLSHVAFVHENTFGRAQEGDEGDPAERSSTGLMAKRIERGVRSDFWRTDVAGRKVVQGDDTVGDIWHRTDFMVPGIFLTNMTTYPAGTAELSGGGEPSEDIVPINSSLTAQAVTPLGRGKTRYFYCFGPQLTDMSKEIADQAWDVFIEAFAEDKRMIEAQHRMIQQHPGHRMGSISADRGLGMFRVIMSRLKADEAEIDDKRRASGPGSSADDQLAIAD